MFQDLETNNIGSKDEEEDEAALIDMFMELARRDEVCYQFCSVLFCQFVSFAVCIDFNSDLRSDIKL